MSANSILRLLNLVYYSTSPFKKEFTNEPVIDISYTDEPDMGNPNQEDETQKKSSFALLKEKER